MPTVPDPAETDFRQPLVAMPERGRRFRARRRIRLGDADPSGRLRLDAIARYLQDVASDDVYDAGWRSFEHFWLIRRTEIRVLVPPRFDEEVELTTWASGAGVSAAARRTTLAGERGSLIEAESIWIHLDSSLRPARLHERFQEVYGEAWGGRRVTPRLVLPDPPPGARSRPWSSRFADADVLGHMNNAAYWQGVEEVLSEAGLPLGGVLAAAIEFRRPIVPADAVELHHASHDGVVEIGFAVRDDIRAAAAVGLGSTPDRIPPVS